MSTSSTASSSSASHGSASPEAGSNAASAQNQRRAEGDAGDATRRNSGPVPSLRRSDTMGQLAAILSDDYIGESKPLLLAVPISIVASLIPRMPAVVVFVLNAAALVPLAALNILSVLTMTKNARVWGGLVRAVGGNGTEFIVSKIKPMPSLWRFFLSLILFLSLFGCLSVVSANLRFLHSSALLPWRMDRVPWCSKP